MNHIIPPSFLFDYLPCIQRIDNWQCEKTYKPLPDSSAIFIPGSLNSRHSPFSLRLGWNPSGLGIDVTVTDKKMPVSGDSSQLRDSDYVSIMIDTRHTANVHRATGYCTSLIAMPADNTRKGKPVIIAREIAQQRELRKQLDPAKCAIASMVKADGYHLAVWLPASELPGFNEIAEIGRIGFYIIVHDTELGELPLNVGDDFPITFDPATWLQFDLSEAIR